MLDPKSPLDQAQAFLEDFDAARAKKISGSGMPSTDSA